MAKSPIEVALPCCMMSVAKVTTRKSRMKERPRNHSCRSCGKEYRIDAMKNYSVTPKN